MFLIKCPYCKELIKSGAIKCKHCHSTIGKNGKIVSPADDENLKYLQNSFSKIDNEFDAIERNMKMRTGFLFNKYQYTSDDLCCAIGRIKTFAEKMGEDLEEWEAVNKLTEQVQSFFNKKVRELYQRLEYLQIEIIQREPTWWEKVKEIIKWLAEIIISFFTSKVMMSAKAMA